MTETRADLFKNHSRTSQSLRERRAYENVGIRKRKTEEILERKRRSSEQSEIDDIEKPNDAVFDVNKLASLLSEVNNNPGGTDDSQQEIIDEVKKFRAYFLATRSTVREVDLHSVLDHFKQIIYLHNPLLRHHVLLALTLISCGTSEDVDCLIHTGIIPIVIDLMTKSTDMEVLEQTILITGNVLGDDPEHRDYCVEHDLLYAIDLLSNKFSASLPVLRLVSWMTYNLCKSKDSSYCTELVVESLLPSLQTYLEKDDPELLTNTLWAIGAIAEGNDELVQVLLNYDFLPLIVGKMGHVHEKVLLGAIRAVGSLIVGDELYTTCVLEHNVLEYIDKLLDHKVPIIVQETAWLLSNITADHSDHLEQVNSSGLLAKIISLMSSANFSTQRNCAWCIGNSTLSANKDQMKVLIDAMAVPQLALMLKFNETDLSIMILESLLAILRSAEELTYQVCEQLEQCGALDLIESLQVQPDCGNELLSRLSARIIDDYFSTPDEIDASMSFTQWEQIQESAQPMHF